MKEQFNPFDYLKEGSKYEIPERSTKDLKSAFIFESPEAEASFAFVPVDNWVMTPQDIIFNYTKGSLIANVTGFYGVDPANAKGLDYFMLSQKKCYNSTKMQAHMCRYLNYFEKFYDHDSEYQVYLFYIKYLIDFEKKYNKQCLIYDLNRYILSPSIVSKVRQMVDANYALDLTYKNARNASLQYTNEHAKILFTISIITNLMIPLLTHFAYVKKVEDIDSFLLEMYDLVFEVFSDVDIYNKIYETCYTNIVNNRNKNEGVWNKQDIRGKNVTTHSMSSADNIILNIIPKYTFERNIISFNYSSILTNTKFQVSDIAYEYTYIPLSSSKMDADNTSDFDRIMSPVAEMLLEELL